MGGTLNRSRSAVAHEKRGEVKFELARICQELWNLPINSLEGSDAYSIIEATEKIRLVVESLEEEG